MFVLFGIAFDRCNTVVCESYRRVSQVRQQQQMVWIPGKRAAERNADLVQAEVAATQRAQHLALESARQAAAASEERAHAAASARAAAELAQVLGEQEARAIEAENVRLRAKKLVEAELRRRAEALQAQELAAEEAARRYMRLQVDLARRVAAEARAEAQERSVFEERATEQGQVLAPQVGAQNASFQRWQAVADALEVRSQQAALEQVQSQAEAQRLLAQELQDAETARTVAELAEVNRAHHAAEAASEKAADLFQQASKLQAQSDEQRAEVGRLRAQQQDDLERREDRARRLLQQGIVEVDLDTSDDEVVEDTLDKSAKVQKLQAAHTQTSETCLKTGSLDKMRQRRYCMKRYARVQALYS
jgi:hypothetical protein